jgi:hypothetical protein
LEKERLLKEKELLAQQLQKAEAQKQQRKETLLQTAPQEVKAFLDGLGMIEYLEAFMDNGYDSIDAIALLDDKDMDLLHILPGHRKKLRNSINKLAPSTSNAAVEQPKTAEQMQDKTPSLSEEKAKDKDQIQQLVQQKFENTKVSNKAETPEPAPQPQEPQKPVTVPAEKPQREKPALPPKREATETKPATTPESKESTLPSSNVPRLSNPQRAAQPKRPPSKSKPNKDDAESSDRGTSTLDQPKDQPEPIVTKPTPKIEPSPVEPAKAPRSGSH